MINLRNFTREERAAIANDWLNVINQNYSELVSYSITDTRRYYGRNNSWFSNLERGKAPKTSNVSIRIIPVDSVTCLFEGLEYNANPERKVAILNFASFKNPGGMFLNGSPAQEESLCHQSLLYPILKDFTQDYYEEHKKHLNKALYTTDILYLPDVHFYDQTILSVKERDGKYIVKRKLNDRVKIADVITCAAPNAGTYFKFYGKPEDTGKVEEELDFRIRAILNIARRNGVQDLILGAYGCGVFKCDPEMVAKIFFKYLRDPSVVGDVIRTAYFPIPISKFDKNFDTFWKCYEQKDNLK